MTATTLVIVRVDWTVIAPRRPHNQRNAHNVLDADTVSLSLSLSLSVCLCRIDLHLGDGETGRGAPHRRIPNATTSINVATTLLYVFCRSVFLLYLSQTPQCHCSALRH